MSENREYIIDNFAGGGGASTGIELALGQPIDIAVNHDGDAIAMHTVTHFYGHSFSLDNKPPNISPFRLEWMAQRKSEVNEKNCY